MNVVKTVFSKFASRIPQAPQGAVPGGSGGSAALKFLAVVGLGSYGVYHSMVTIQPGHAGIIYNRLGGLDEKTLLTEGLNFVIPWAQRVITYDIRTRPKPIDTQSGSKGMTTLQLAYLNWIKLICACVYRFANGANFYACFVQA